METMGMQNLDYNGPEAKLYLEEKLILEFTECVAEVMETKGIRKTDLANKLGKTKGYITQVLNGRANMTLRTVADLMWALESSLKISASEIQGPTKNDYGVDFGAKHAEFWNQDNISINLSGCMNPPVQTNEQVLRQAG